MPGAVLDLLPIQTLVVFIALGEKYDYPHVTDDETDSEKFCD